MIISSDVTDAARRLLIIPCSRVRAACSFPVPGAPNSLFRWDLVGAGPLGKSLTKQGLDPPAAAPASGKFPAGRELGFSVWPSPSAPPRPSPSAACPDMRTPMRNPRLVKRSPPSIRSASIRSPEGSVALARADKIADEVGRCPQNTRAAEEADGRSAVAGGKTMKAGPRQRGALLGDAPDGRELRPAAPARVVAVQPRATDRALFQHCGSHGAPSPDQASR